MSQTIETKELRCSDCGKLLAEKAGKGTVIVCNRCGTKNEVDNAD
jgi:phage FluMu protein Com